MRSDLAARLTGSAELFDRRRRRPWASVNYVASHDGFTLRDLVSYEERHNWANGEDNRDGHAENFSRNWGVEGDTDDPAIRATRAAVQRALLATLFVSAGTPMLLAGDELDRTQRGNNNAYCQDNETSWVDWAHAASPEAEALRRFVARLTALRRRFATLRPATFLHGVSHLRPGLNDIAWFGQHGEPMTPEAWNEPEARTLMLRRAAAAPDGAVEVTLLLLNADGAGHVFVLPPPRLDWTLVLDSAHPEAPEHAVHGASVRVAARAVALLAARLPPE
jgi:isoamylase